MYGCRLEPIFLNDPSSGLELNTNLKPPPKVMLDVVCRDLTDGSLSERLLEMHAGSFIRLVGFLCADRRLGIILQEKIHPVREL